MTPLKARPTQKELDELHKKSNRARILYPVARPGAPKPSSHVLTDARFAELHAALRLRDDEVPMGCHCPGTVTVELLHGTTKAATLVLHLHRHAHSLWLAGSTTGAALRDGDTLLDLLAQWGIPQPLQIVLESEREKTQRGSLLQNKALKKKSPKDAD